MDARYSGPGRAGGRQRPLQRRAVLQPARAARQERAGCAPLATGAAEATLAEACRGPALPAPGSGRAWSHRGDVHWPLDVPRAGRRDLRADRPDLVAAVQPRLLRRPAPRPAAGTEPGCAARRGPAAGHAQPLRPHGPADAAKGAPALGAADGNRPGQRTSSFEGRHSRCRRVGLVAEHRACGGTDHLRAGTAFLVAHVA